MLAHFRPLLFTFLALALGIYLGKLYFYESPIYFYIVGGVLISLILCSLLYLVVKNKVFKNLWNLKWKFLTIIVFFFLGFAMFDFNYYNSGSNFESNKNLDYYVVGIVSENTVINDDILSFYIENATVVYDSTEYKPQNRILVKVDISLVDDTNEIFNLEPNDMVVFVAKIYNSPIFNKEYLNSYAYKNNYQHKAYVDANDLIISKGSLGLLDSVRENIKNLLYGNMSESYANVAYAVLVGDKTFVDDDTLQDFQATGTAHILAVSGLHIGFLVLLLLFILRKIKMKDKWQVLSISIILLLYCMLCGWAVSVIRASIMAVALLLGKAFGQQTDSLSSLSLAGLILLFWQPLMLFDLSFQLSFASVFAIIFLMPVFQNLFKRFRFKKFWDLLALSLSAQIGTLPFLINAFDYISVIGLIANLVVVPFFGVVYMCLFLFVIITLIFPFLSFLLWLLQWGIFLVLWTCNLFANVTFATTTLPAFYDWVIIIYLFAMFSISYNCLFSKLSKILIFCFCCLAVCCGTFAVYLDNLNSQIAFTNMKMCVKLCYI